MSEPTNERKHRCLTCGQLKSESELYYGDKDWACVDPKHGVSFLPTSEYDSFKTVGENPVRLVDLFPDGIEFRVSGDKVELLTEPASEYRTREPIREDYNELTTAFARILFAWKFTIPDSVDVEHRDRLIRDYFLGGIGKSYGRAHYVLTALVSTAMRQRSRWGKSKQEREAEDAREVERAMRAMATSSGDKPAFRGIAFTAPPSYVERELQWFGFRCPFCFNLTDRNGVTCTSCGKATRPEVPPGMEVPE